MSEEGLSRLHAVIAERKAKAATKAAEANLADELADLIPEAQYELTEEQKELDGILDKLDIITAYRKWSNKSSIDARPGQKEGIMVSCPNPAHPDKHPSAWINTEKQVWHCAACELGGDKYDIAAWHFGFPVPGYKSGKAFHDLREKMAEDMGYVVEKRIGAPPLIYLPEEVTAEAPVAPDLEPEGEPPSPLAAVLSIVPEDDTPIESLSIDWRSIVTPDTFLHDYLSATTIDDAAEEYHFWNGLLALGMAVGLDVKLYDGRSVYANLLVCILGATGDRKSRSFGYLKRLLKEALPSKSGDPDDKGVYVPGAIASGEALIGAFERRILDPTNPKVTVGYGAVRGLVEFNELSSLVSRTSRLGATLKDVIMQFADTDDIIATTSVTHGMKRAENPFCSIFTTTQPESMKELVKKTDTTSGFLNRWIFASGTSKKRIPIGEIPVDLSDAVDKIRLIHGWPGLAGRTITWSEAGAKHFTDHFYTRIEKDQEGQPILARLDLIEKKLILLFCINEMQKEVTEEIVDKVIAMHDYLVAIFKRSAASAGGHETADIYEELTKQIKLLSKKMPNGVVTWRRVYGNIKHKNWNMNQVNSMWKMLKETGEVEEVKINEGKRGRPSFGYKWIGEAEG